MYIYTQDNYYIFLSENDIQNFVDGSEPNTTFIEYPSNFSCPYKKISCFVTLWELEFY